MIRCTVGVMAYNEEESIVPVLQALLAQRTDQCVVLEIVVMISGSTDQTAERARAVARSHPIIRVDVEPVRSGKAAAVNRLIGQAQGDVLVLVGADTLPDPTALERLVAPFADPQVGMTGARVVPLNNARGPLGWLVHLLWHLHHQLALQSPKLGELVAFRKVVEVSPADTATDEVALEAALTARGYRLVYVPEAIVYNYGPETLRDFLAQRRRIFAGHLHIAERVGYRPASMHNERLLRLCLETVMRHPPLILWLCFTVVLEACARLLGLADYLCAHDHRLWRRVHSTKQVHREGRSLRLAVINCRNTLSTGDLLHCAARIPPELGTLVWWDAPLSEAVFALPLAESYTLEEQLAELADHFGPRSRLMIAYRLIEFPIWKASDYIPPLEERAVCAAAY